MTAAMHQMAYWRQKVPDPTRAEHSDFDLNRAVAR